MSASLALVRADASTTIGTGHVVRCLALADELAARGWTIRFASRPMPGALRTSVMQRGYALIDLGEAGDPLAEPARLLSKLSGTTADVVIVDHYGLGAAWHRSAREWAATVVAIDDLACRPLDADLVVNQNLGETTESYARLVPPTSVLLVGPQYAMLRRQFPETRARALRVRRAVGHILVFLSGTDEHDATFPAARAAATLGVSCDVVVGAAYQHLDRLRAWATGHPHVTLHRDVADMASLMNRADVSIGAPSSATWERCCLGLPSILVTLADNQSRAATALERAGAAVTVGRYDEGAEERLAAELAALAADPERLAAMSLAAASITDGRGVRRVADAVDRLASKPSARKARPYQEVHVPDEAIGVALRRLRLDDLIRVREWRNLSEVARYMYTDHEISEGEHARWFGDALDRPDRRYWIIELDGVRVGLANLTDISERHRRAMWAFYLADPAVRGRGVGSFTERFMLREAFEELKLNKLCCEVLGSNEAVVAMHRKFGFVVDGVLRSHIWKGDHFEDVVTLSMTADEYARSRHTDG